MRISKTVLVVDDNSLNLEICREILDGDYEVLTARDGSEAIRLASRHKPGVILLDIMLPNMDGYETCRRLRNVSATRNTTIIMVSAKAMPSERAEGLAAGADFYLTKPFDDSELLTAIRSCQESENNESMPWRIEQSIAE
jgi:CheY-like chemotaxis protein